MTIINAIKARIRIDITKKYAELNMKSTSLRIKFLNFSDLKHQITIAIKQQNLINAIHINLSKYNQNPNKASNNSMIIIIAPTGTANDKVNKVMIIVNVRE